MHDKAIVQGRSWFEIRRAIALTGCFLSTLLGNSAFAQIIPDGTLGAEGSLVTPNLNINGGNADRIDGGATRGANLFHSFEQFNIGDGQRVYFANPVGIENILSRVTGTNSSNIQGTLGVTGGNANLFLMNPNGIIFGENASLSLNGSFVASTANSLIFADGTQFSAKVPQTAPLLTVSVPIGLQFGSTPGNIQVQGTGNNLGVTPAQLTPLGLQMQPGNTLALVGGNVLLEGGIVTLPDGRIELGSVASEGVVSLTSTNNGWIFGYQNVPNFGDIVLSKRALVEGGALIEASTSFSGDGAGNGGQVIVNASESLQVIGRSSLTQQPSILTADSLGTGQAGDLEINTSRLIIRDGAQVTVSGEGTGDAGILRVNADAIVLENQGKLTGTTASGRGGDIALQVRDYILMRHGSLLTTTAQNDGDGGNITINSPFIVAIPNENSDIIANADQGFGGRIDISSTGIYGLEFRENLTPLSDINASSNATAKDGIVEINTSDIDPSRGLTNLPTDVTDASNQIAQDCQSGGGKASGSLINNGRGGLPTNPYEPLTSSEILTDVQPPSQWVENSTSSSIQTTSNRLVEANEWIINENGEVVLVAQAPPTSSQWGCNLR